MAQVSLENIYLFKGMSSAELAKVSEIGTVSRFGSGETVFIKGEKSKALFFIKFGSVKIQQTTAAGDSLNVATLGTGSHFGEMGFIDDEPRSATAVAAEPSEIIVIPYEGLKAFLEANKDAAVKFYKQISHFLCGRLRATTTDLNFAREKNLSHF